MNTTDILSIMSSILHKANKVIEQKLTKNGIEGLVPSHMEIILQLFENKSLTMNQLAKLINKDKSTVTVLVRKLEKMGYIQKSRDYEDARYYWISFSLTDKGNQTIPTFTTIFEQILSTIYQDFTEKEKATIMELLTKIKF
jgi:DNA-binding MarR family transcriptional regulator